jgi:hypothetical protein
METLMFAGRRNELLRPVIHPCNRRAEMSVMDLMT